MNTLENGVFRKTLLGLLEKAGNGNMCPVSKRSHRPISGLCHYGFPQVYGNNYMDEDDPFAYKIDCILFAADDDCIASLNEYAKRKFHSLNDQYRKYIVGKSEQLKKQYSDIIAEESQRADFVCRRAIRPGRSGRCAFPTR